MTTKRDSKPEPKPKSDTRPKPKKEAVRDLEAKGENVRGGTGKIEFPNLKVR